MSNTIYELQLQDSFTGQSIIAAGGIVMVVAAGGTKKVTLLDPANGYAPLANPFVPVRGHIQFATPNVGNASMASTQVDVYGMTPGGRFFAVRNAQVGNPTEVTIHGNGRRDAMIVPFNIADTTAGVETDTGFDFPVNSLVCSPTVVNVQTFEAGRTINAGLLSTQTGGNASGLIAGLSLATAGLVKPTMAGTPTIGALLRATSSSTQVPEDAPITTATRLSFTLSAGTVQATGFIVAPYQLTA